MQAARGAALNMETWLEAIAWPTLAASRAILVLVLALWLPATGGCQSSGTATGLAVTNEALIGPDYRHRGPHPFEMEEGSLRSETGCTVTYRLFRPRPTGDAVLVVLGHGFMRSKERMEQLAEHLASWQIPVVTVDFCNSRWWKGNHDRNAADMVAISEKLKAKHTLYSGFSAGGLAALIAAAQDPGAAAYLGLDMVDNGNMAEKLAPHVAFPLYGLIVAPAACNARNNGLRAYARAERAVVVKVFDASHCHFEFPMDWKCTLVCGTAEARFGRQEIQQIILGLITSFVRWRSGLDPEAGDWWAEGGQNYRTLVAAGYLERVEKHREGP